MAVTYSQHGAIVRTVESTYEGVKLGDTVYPVVTIGNRKWTATNLDWVPSGFVEEGEMSSNNPACASYGGNRRLAHLYGLYYNYKALEALNNNGILPEGWRIPTSTDWNDLFTRAGGLGAAGKALMSTYVGGTNTVAFNMFPVGHRSGSSNYNLDSNVTVAYLGNDGSKYNGYRLTTNGSAVESVQLTLNSVGTVVRLVKDA